jgi:hypothetical protein
VTLILAGVCARQSLVTPLKRAYVYRFNSTFPINRVISMGERNSKLEPA